MNIIYLTKNMKKYEGAFYPQDVIEELSNQANVYLYGPGFSDFNNLDNIDNIIKKSKFHEVNAIIAGHSWLNDSPEKKQICDFQNISFKKIKNIKKILILNKEYARLKEKLEYIRNNNFDLVFTHHHDTDSYEKETGLKFIFWPFAVNANKLIKPEIRKIKKYDISFTGILQNPTHPSKHSNLRSQIENYLFFRFFSIPFIKRKKFKNFNFYWHTFGRGRILDLISSFLQSPRLPSNQYFEHLQNSKLTINTLSPLGLIGTRYFESMICRSLVICEKSHLYNGIFEDKKHCLMFKPDLSDLDIILQNILDNNIEYQRITSNAHDLVLNKHTWKVRIQKLIKIL